MSAIPSDIYFYGSANMPEADGVTVGGAVDFSKKVSFSDISPTGTMDYVSSSASDTATKIIVQGRDSTGVIQTETKTLTGQTPVTGSQSFERLLAGASSGASANGPLANPGGTTAVGDVAAISHTAVVSGTAQTGAANKTGTTPALFKLAAGQGASVALGQIIRTTGGTGPNQLRQIVAITGYGTDVVAVNRDWGTLPDNTTTYTVNEGMLFDLSPNQVTAVIRAFSTAAADVPGGSSRTYYEKVFAVNNDTATALTSAVITILSESGALPGSAALDIGLNKALNDTATAANRQTLPVNGDASAITFTTGSPPQSQNVPSPQNLPSGAAPNSAGAEGVWLRLILPAGTTSYKGVATLRGAGNTV